MEKIRILLSVQQELQAQLLRFFFKTNGGFELIGESLEVIDILMMTKQHKPDLWIHSWDQSDELEGLLSHVYDCHPDLSVVRISPDEVTGFAQRPINSIAELIDFAETSGSVVANS